MSAPPAQPNQSLIDGLEVLQALATATAPVGSREMGRRLGLEPTRVNRLLKTLASLGLAEQTPDRRYASGPGMHVLSAAALFGSGLLRKATAPLESLRDLKLTIAMGVLWRRQVAYLVHVMPNRSIAEGIGRTAAYPAEQSSIGVALMARLPQEQALARFVDPPLPDDALRALKQDLAHARREGFALVHPKHGTPTLAVAIGERPVAAIALAGQFNDHDIPKLVERLREAARRISIDET